MEKLVPQIKKDVHEKQEPKIEIEYNNYEYKWLLENGLQHWIKSDKGQTRVLNAGYYERRFLGKVEPSKMQRNVTRMYRFKALDFITNPNKPKTREFLKVIEDWYGKSADGKDVDPVRDHVNGVYNQLKLNEKGDPEKTGNLMYYIPFTKENVDEWVNQSWTTDKESIEFWVQVPKTLRRKQVSYDEFVGLKLDELVQKIDAKPSNVAVAQPETALQVLDKRYANGDITDAEYLKRKKVLAQ